MSHPPPGPSPASTPSSSTLHPPGMARTRSKNPSRAGARSADPTKDSHSHSKDATAAPKKDFKVLRPDTFSQGASLYLRPDPPPEPKPRVPPNPPIAASARSRSRNPPGVAGPSSRPARPTAATSSWSSASSSGPKPSRPLLRSAHLLAPVTMQKEIVIVTSRGTFIVKAGPESTIDWALEVASDLMMAANPLGAVDEGTRVVLVAARTGSGLVASEENLVFDVCKEDKILFAITADETANIPPSFAHAFAASPVSPEEHARAQRLNRRDSHANILQLADHPGAIVSPQATSPASAVSESKSGVSSEGSDGVPTTGVSVLRSRKPGLEKFRSNIRMSVAMTNYVDDLNAMVSQLEKTEAAAAAKQAEEKRRRNELLEISDANNPGTGKNSALTSDDVAISAVTVLNPFGAETEADVVVDGDESAPNSRRGSTEYKAPADSVDAAEKASRRITRASALSILMDILPPMTSFLDSAPRIARGSLGESPSMKPRKTLMVANPDTSSESEEDRPPLPSVSTPPVIPKPNAVPVPNKRNSVPKWLADEAVGMPPVPPPVPPIVSDVVEQVVKTPTTSIPTPPAMSPSGAPKYGGSGGGNSKNDLMAALNDPNLRNRLKKRGPPPEKPVAAAATPKISPEEEKLLMEAEKQELFIELLGFMEAPNGNVEDLLTKLVAATKTVRSYIFLLIRRKWLDGVRVLKQGEPKPEKPCIVWQNMEVTTYIELKDVYEKELQEAFEDDESINRGIVARVHMYRYDEKSRKHLTDEIALMKTRHFPKQIRKFDLPEPPGKDQSLEKRKKWDEWFEKKQQYMQADMPQFELIFKKLLIADETVSNTNIQLEQTLQEMKRMGEALNETFDGFSPKQLRSIIEQIPKRVRAIAKSLEQSTGMIIKADGLKVTPDFLKKMDLSVDDPTGMKRAETAAIDVAAASIPANPPPAPAAQTLAQPSAGAGEPPKQSDVKLTEKPATEEPSQISPAAENASGSAESSNSGENAEAGTATNSSGMITMAGVPIDNVNNWHWVEKNCIPWATEYVSGQVSGISVTVDGTTVTTTEVVGFSGDADINQRKGKLITVYDISFTVKWKATTADGTEVLGRINVPEFMHDTDVDELVTEVTTEEQNSTSQAVRTIVIKSIVPLVQKKLANFSTEMIASNGKDVHISKENMVGHPAGTAYKPKPAVPDTLAQETTTAPSTVKGAVSTITMNVEFVCSASDLFSTLLDPARVQVWTRGPAIIKPEAGAEVSLFGGNVTGKILEIVPNKKIVQTWRLKSWPSSHYSTVTLTLEEQRESVTLRLSQTDVPIGEKELTTTNWTGYYFNGIKSAFGYGAPDICDEAAIPSVVFEHRRRAQQWQPKQRRSGQFDFTNLDQSDAVHIVASVFKQWIRDLPDGVIPKKYFQPFADCTGIPGKLQAVIKSLPVVNREVLEYILRFLLKVVSYSSKNLMSVQNLVIVFAPNLFLCPSAPNPPMSPNGNPEKFLVESMQVTKILASIFDHFHEIFEPTEVNNKISSTRSTNKLTQQQLPATLSRTKPEDKENQDAMVEKEIKNTISSMLFSSKPTSEKSNSKSKFADFNSALFSDLKMKVQQIQKVRETSPSSQEKTETEIFESPEYPQSVSRRPTKLSIDPSKRLGICDESLSLQSGSRTAVYFSDSASVSAINPQSINTLGDASTQSFQEASDEAIPASKRKSVSFSSGISGKASHSYESGLTNLAGPPPPPNKPAPIAPATAKFSAYSADPEIRTKKPVDKELRSDSGDSKHEGDDELSLNQSVNSAEFGSISDEEDSKLLVQTSLKVTTCPNYETLTPQ
ncbi:hypothetical protein HDU82_000138 [Entophlyctis luteolus]|nr:hypothetical protein HDU82_000138 [Entophlyctis luteolus]